MIPAFLLGLLFGMLVAVALRILDGADYDRGYEDGYDDAVYSGDAS